MCQKEFTFIENDLTMVSHSSLFTKRGVCYGSGATIVSHNTRIFIHLRANYSIEYSLNLFYTHHLSRSDTNVSNEISVSAWLRWVGNSDFCDRLASYFIQSGIFQTEGIQQIDYMISYNDAGF